MRKIIFGVLFILQFNLGFAQTIQEPILDSTERLQTDVFVLDASEPTQISLYRKYDDYKYVKAMPMKRLEIDHKKMSGFVIKNINPLRYRYLINNSLITSFFNTPTSTTESTVSPKENPIADIISSTIVDARLEEIISEKNKIQEIIDKMEAKKKAFQKINSQIKTWYTTIGDYAKFDSITYRWIAKTATKENKAEVKREYDKYYGYYNDLDSLKSILDDDYNAVFAELNQKSDNSISEIQKVFNKSYDSTIAIPAKIPQIDSNFYLIKSQYLTDIGTYDSTLKYIQSCYTNYIKLQNYTSRTPRLELELYYNISAQRLKNFLIKINYNSPSLEELLNQTSTSYYSGNENKDNKYVFTLEQIKLSEYVSTKKSQAIQNFLFFGYDQIGKLLQSKITQYSLLLNNYSNLSYIDDHTQTEIKTNRDEIESIFKYIQTRISDLSAVTKSLKISPTTFKNTGNKIIDNYDKLLDYLKKLEFITKNTRIEYSLPTSNNLQNVDLIRYKVDWIDLKKGQSDSRTYDVWIKGGWKIDFSVGIFASSLIDAQYNKIPYSYYDTGSKSQFIDSSKTLVTTKQLGLFDFAFGGIVNFYPRNGAKWLNIGASLGVTYSKNNSLQFLIGGALHIGKTERLILHGGLALGFVKELDKSQYTFLKPSLNDHDIDKDSKLIVNNSLANTNIATIDKFKGQWYFGISYNLSKQNPFTPLEKRP